jgi:glutamyl-tRNA synthetase
LHTEYILLGLLRRGLTVQALEKFILEQGASKNLNNMDMNKLWALNREIIDPIVPRFTAISKENM